MLHFYQIHHFHVNSLVLHYITHWRPLAYGVIFFGMIFEGDIFLFTAAFLASQKFLGIAPTLLSLFGGVLLGDSLWYLLGYKINHSDTRIGRWLVKATGRLDEHLLKNPLRTIFISKFIYGIHHLILARAGVLKLKYKEFFKDDIISNLGWIAIVGGLGYLSGASFIYIKRYLRFAEYALVLGLILFLVSDYFISKYGLEKKI